jgi:hypothetical protein
MEGRPPIRMVAANKFNKQSRTADRGGPPAWGLGEVLTTLPVKTDVKLYPQGEMLPLETKQFGGKCGEFLD